MAVGIIMRCDVCGKSYDEGRQYHPAHCDGGEAKRANEKHLKRLKAQAVEVTIEEFHERLRRLEQSIGRMPYDGPIG